MNSPLEELAALVVKTGVALGGLTQPQRDTALAVAAAALPLQPLLAQAPTPTPTPTPTPAFSEGEVNAALKQCIAGPARFLATDHVELRRWLIDIGWWRRDGFGRAYERVPAAELPATLQAIERALHGIDFDTWAADHRGTVRAQRDARRQAWQARESAPRHG